MLTPLELDIMKAVWQDPPATVRDVQEKIRPARNLAYTTVMTIMDRLYHKGFLSRKMESRTHHYEPAIAYTDVRDEAVRNLVTAFFGGSKNELRDFLDGNSQKPVQPMHSPSASDFLDETLL